MNVEGILRAKGDEVVTIRPDETIATLVTRLRLRRIGALVVSEDGRSIAGMISERDVVRGLAEHGASVLALPVSRLMTPEVISCRPEDTVKDLMEVMTARRIRHLPVLRNGSLGGIVSIGDVVKGRLAELQTEANVLREAYLARK
jgi:CBS domain-containing protein